MFIVGLPYLCYVCTHSDTHRKHFQQSSVLNICQRCSLNSIATTYIASCNKHYRPPKDDLKYTRVCVCACVRACVRVYVCVSEYE